MQGHGQFFIDTYNLEVSNKTQVSDPGLLCPLLLCVNTWYAIIVHIKCCFHLKCLLYVRHILNMAIPSYTSNNNTCIPQNIPRYKNVRLKGKQQKYLAGFISIHD